jgi:hypothetical protein
MELISKMGTLDKVMEWRWQDSSGSSQEQVTSSCEYGGEIINK